MHVNKLKRFFYVKFGLLILTALLQNIAFAEGDVTATFRIDSVYLKSLLSTETITQIEAGVAQSLAAEAETHFPFLKWQPAASAEARGPQLILRMQDISDGTCDRPPTIQLQWSKLIDESESEISGLAHYDLYHTCDPEIPTQEPERLQSDIVNAVVETLKNEGTRNEILDELVSKVPFASELEFREGDIVGGEPVNNKIFIPVSVSALSASLNSKMSAKIKFLHEGADSATKSTLHMKRTDEVDLPVDCTPACTPIILQAITVGGGPLDVPNRFETWPPDLMGMLTRHTEIKVFMTTYEQETPEPFVDINNGIILEIGDDDE